MSKFEEFREQYKSFIFKDYSIQREGDLYVVKYYFEIPGLTEFESGWKFPVKLDVDEKILDKLVFSLGMVESISYWKTVCPKELIIKCGKLTKDQCIWWRKLYFNGLGEFLYRNGIEVSEEDLVNIQCEEADGAVLQDSRVYEGCIVPVGGGKDSVVSLEVLKNQSIATYCINKNETMKNVIDVCDHKKDEFVTRRILDPKIIELNKAGYLNGHIPFSAVVAFSSVITAFLNGYKYIVLSNETSANETTVVNSNVNHQYSKSYEFENDFQNYIKGLTTSDIHYFSFLRPLAEIQIAQLFSGFSKYHSVFRSCNVGSKTGIWCGNCPKCLFVYIILSPFLNETELKDIFGENLLNKESMELYFRELTGLEENKPFECVGTRAEVQVALKAFVKKGGVSLLTEKYKEMILNVPGELEDMLNDWNDENSLPEAYEELLKECIHEHNQ